MKKTKQTKQGKRLLVSKEKVRDLQPKQLDAANVAGARSPCGDISIVPTCTTSGTCGFSNGGAAL